MSEEERDTISGIVGSREKERGRWPTWSSMKKKGRPRIDSAHIFNRQNIVPFLL